jgi:hypothetical protein
MEFALIKQPSGLGDLFYIQKIVCKIIEKYKPKKVIWPLCEEYFKIKDYFNLPKEVDFVHEEENFLGKDLYCSDEHNIIFTDDFIYAPLQYSHFILYGGAWRYIMQAKYEIVGLQCDDWYNYVNINRNTEKEKQLFSKKVNFSEPYIVVNRQWGAGTPRLRHDLMPQSSLKVIELTYEPGYSLFDWMKILEEAKEVHTIETSLAYILHLLKKDEVYLYYRIENQSAKQDMLFQAWKNFDYCNKIYTNPNWNFEKW